MSEVKGNGILKKADEPAKYVVVNYNKFVVESFVNPATQELDAIESTDYQEAQKYVTAGEAIKAMATLLQSGKFYRNGSPTLQVQKLGRQF